MSPPLDRSNLIGNPLLRNFYQLGAWSERNFGPIVSRAADGVGQTAAAAGKSRSLSSNLSQLEVWTPYDPHYREHPELPTPKKPAPAWTRVFSVLGNSLDAASGVLSLAQTYKQDVDMGKASGSSRLIKSATGSVLQIGSGAYAGGLIAGGMAALGAPVILGVGLGAGAALGAGYLAGRIFDWGWGAIFQ